MSGADQLSKASSATVSISAELRAARMARKLSVEDVAQGIKLTTTIVNDLESERFSAVGAAVYARGFLRSYARFIGLSSERVEAGIVEQGLGDAPVLLASQGERDRPALGERWMLAASYLVGTAILVSAIFFVMQADRLPLPGSVRSAEPASGAVAVVSGSPELVSEVAPIPATVDGSTAGPTQDLSGSQTQAAQGDAADQAPIAAAMTALPDLGSRGASFQLTTQELAWVEISDASGRRLEFNNVAPDSQHRYQGTPPFDLIIGNAAGAKLNAKGQEFDLLPYIRGSIAKFRLVERDGQLVIEPVLPRVVQP